MAAAAAAAAAAVAAADDRARALSEKQYSNAMSSLDLFADTTSHQFYDDFEDLADRCNWHASILDPIPTPSNNLTSKMRSVFSK